MPVLEATGFVGASCAGPGGTGAWAGGGQDPGTHRPVPVGPCAAQRRLGPVKLTQPVKGSPADAGDATPQRPVYQLAALG